MLKKCGKCFFIVIALILFISHSAFSDVRISTEGEYTDTQLIINIYADTTDTSSGAAEPLVSYGVKITYDPADINNPVVQKNNGEWYFGTAASPLPTPNADPDISIPGEIIIVGGKIDIAAPTEGVSGSKVLLANVTFNRVQTATAPSVSIDLGKGGNFSNFVTNSGAVLDGTLRLTFLPAAINSSCNLRGDINNDNVVNYIDLSILQSNWLKSGGDILNSNADINNDGNVNYIDLSILQSDWLKTCE